MAFTWFQSYHRPDSNIHIWRREIQLFSRLQRSPRLGPGPTLLVSYTDDVGLVDLLERHAVQSHMYADDTQFHDSCPPDIDPLHSRLSPCADINSCLVVQVSSPPAEYRQDRGHLCWISIQSGEDSQLRSLVQVDSSKIQLSAVVRNLGFHLDNELWWSNMWPKWPPSAITTYTTPPPDSTCRPVSHDSAGAR